MNVLLNRIDGDSPSIAHFQLYHCGLFMASTYMNRPLVMDVDARACAMMICACVQI